MTVVLAPVDRHVRTGVGEELLIRLDVASGVDGVLMAVAKGEWPAPLGVVWYRVIQLAAGPAVQATWSYTVPWCRRRGVRWALHQTMVEAFRQVGIRWFVTDLASDDRSMGFLVKAGFQQKEARWELDLIDVDQVAGDSRGGE